MAARYFGVGERAHKILVLQRRQRGHGSAQQQKRHAKPQCGRGALYGHRVAGVNHAHKQAKTFHHKAQADQCHGGALPGQQRAFGGKKYAGVVEVRHREYLRAVG